MQTDTNLFDTAHSGPAKSPAPGAKRRGAQAPLPVRAMRLAVLVYLFACFFWFMAKVIAPLSSWMGRSPLRDLKSWLYRSGLALCAADLLVHLWAAFSRKMKPGKTARDGRNSGGAGASGGSGAAPNESARDGRASGGAGAAKGSLGMIGALAQAAFRAPGAALLYGMCLCALLGSFLHIQYGFSKNLETILWMAIILSLFYNAVYPMGRKALQIYSAVQYAAVLAVWGGACCLSLVQFALQIGKNGPNYASTAWLGGSGFLNHRLYGLFTYPEYGAVAGAAAILAGCYFISAARSKAAKLLLALLQLPIFWYIVLSGSKNGLLSLCSGVFFAVFLTVFGRRRGAPASASGAALSLAFAAGAVLVVLGLAAATKLAAPIVPAVVSDAGAGAPDNRSGRADRIPAARATASDAASEIMSETVSKTAEKALKAPAVKNAGTPESGGGVFSVTAFAAQTERTSTQSLRETAHISPSGAAPEWTSAPAERAADSPAERAAGGGKKSGGLLDRYDHRGDLSSGRTRIWKDYLSLAGEIGLFGLSPENASLYIQEHRPDLYIASYIKRNHPKSYADGYVFHPHSGFLKLYVSAGLVGAALVAVWLALSAARASSFVLRCRSLPRSFIFSCAVAAVCFSSALFDTELFFTKVPTTLFFWFAMAILHRSISGGRG